MKDIDLVVPWVDGSDPVWLEERNKYLKHRSVNPGYYQDWGWMRYWFRCVEENMPWIRYVFFVTYGHIPNWLNVNHPKLKIVKHSEFMPSEFLPTFSSIPMSLNIHRIKELSETFIYAEDDCFFIGKQQPSDYFDENGLPKDYLWLRPITEQFTGDFAHIMLNNMLLIKKHFDMQSLIENCKEKLNSKRYPDNVIKDNRNYCNLKHIPGFYEPHMAYSFRKRTFIELWDAEAIELYKTSMYKFRTISNECCSLMRDWQLASGQFTPYYPLGRYFSDTSDSKLEQLILDNNTKMICINESKKQPYSEQRANQICSYFEKRFPNKSMFEI